MGVFHENPVCMYALCSKKPWHCWIQGMFGCLRKETRRDLDRKKDVINCDTKAPEGQSMYSCGKKERIDQGISLIADF